MAKFVVIQNIPSPYRLHVFNEMCRQLKGRGIDFHVHFMSRGHAERPKSWLNPQIVFPHTYWNDYGFMTHHFNVGMIWHLLRHRPDYLLVGSPFDTLTSIFVAVLVKASKIRCTWVEGQTKTPGRMTGFIGKFKRFILSRFPLVAVPGVDAVKYIQLHQSFTTLKMPSAIFLPNLIDEMRFKPKEQWKADEISRIRKMFECDDSTRVCILPARLELVKGIVPLIKLLNPEIIDGWKICILGQGTLKHEILQTAKERGILNNIKIFDYVKYEEMPKYYAASDLFLLPSIHDPNPLSVVEALHSGLPVAISDRCGNVEEGVIDGDNGFVLHVLDDIKFKEDLQKVFSLDSKCLKAMGRKSKLSNAEFWNTQKMIERFVNQVIGD